MTKQDEILRILFDWESISLPELTNLANNLPIKIIRWLAMTHPNNRTREHLFRLSNVEIGESTVINQNLFINSYKPLVKIGDRVAIAANVSLIVESEPNCSKLKDFDFIKENYVKEAKICIENDAWIGTGVIILPGIVIGEFSIVGAGSVVTKNVPPMSVVAGTPARLIRRLNFDDTI